MSRNSWAARRPFSLAALTSLLLLGRERNHAQGLTGVLLYAEGSFLQVLEGSAAAVRSTFARIEADPAWMKGEYTKQPLLGIRTASSISVIAGSAPLNAQANYPTNSEAIAAVRRSVERDISHRDANDMIYQFDSSRNYNPWPKLEAVTAPMTWINSADDFINPRNLDVPAQAQKRMKTMTFRLIPESADTHGHGTHTWAKFWKADLSALLARSE